MQGCGQGQPISSISISASDEVLAAAKESMALAGIGMSDEPALTIVVERNTGEHNMIAFDSVDAKGVVLACNIAQQLSQLTASSFTVQEPAKGESSRLRMILITTPDNPVNDRQLGQAIGRAVAVYSR
jgi:hypothetical protein